MNINVVTVIGANGTMGCRVSGIFASFGDAKVYMVSRELEAAYKAKAKAVMSVRAEAIASNLIPKTYCDLEECISESDLVFESVAEDISVKKNVYKGFAEYVRPNAIVATGTSGLSVNQLSECFDEKIRRRFVGMHMYNPPYYMTLCEVIPSRYTDARIVDEIKTYLKDVLYRDVVEVKDEPAFMGNRIGFQFINEAMQYAEVYKDNGGIDYIDSILGPFTGRSMPPLVTSDFVGLDVHKAIADNIYHNTSDYAHKSFAMPEFALELILQGKLGKKSGCGLYQTVVKADGSRIVNVYDIVTGEYRVREQFVFPFAKEMIQEFKVGNYAQAFRKLISNHSVEATICIQFLIKYVIYAISISKSIGEDIHSADIVMSRGFDWVPPLAAIDAFGGVESFKKIASNRLSKEFLSSIDIDDILTDIPRSRCDFRPFFKAR
ncbi:MAG: 3-hydroxyacyl-CoA dehydrogenase family protein [Limnochordia bacterium]|nr:3-hydroxyacyl-CoA dehydrogenase family protein [Limnochordia bacterium]